MLLPTFNSMHGRSQVVKVLVKHFLYGGDCGSLGEWPSINDGRALAGELLAGVWLAEQLLGDLAEVVDETYRGILFQGVVNAGRNGMIFKTCVHEAEMEVGVGWGGANAGKN